MNERIQELLEKAREQTKRGVPTSVFVEKFANLIVRECMDLVASRPYIDDGNWSHPSMMIKQYFGVEE